MKSIGATRLQVKAFDIYKKDLEAGITRPYKAIMKEAGYSDSSAINPQQALLSSDGWKELLAEIDDRPLMKKLTKLSNSKNESIALKAIKELLALKDRYPKEKKSVKGAWKEREGLVFE